MESYGSVVENAGNFVGPTNVVYVAVTVQTLLETTVMMIWRPTQFYVIYVIRKFRIQNGITPKQDIDGIVLFVVKTIEVRLFYVSNFWVFQIVIIW